MPPAPRRAPRGTEARDAKKLGEARGVELAGVPLDRVPGRSSHDDRRIGERDAEPRHVLVHHVPRARGRRLAPDRVDQRVDRRDLADPEKQRAEQCPFAATRQVHTATVDQRLERPENPKSDLRQRARKDRTSKPSTLEMERRWSVGGAAPAHDRAMQTFPLVIGTTLVALTLAAAAPGGTVDSPAAAEYAAAVTQICAGALLFEGEQPIGTRADALAIARAISAATARRLALIATLPVPPELTRLNNRWISSQRRLAALYAQLWVRIYDTVDAAHTPAQMAAVANRLEKLVAAPDAEKAAAGRLELALHVPDCTGGG